MDMESPKRTGRVSPSDIEDCQEYSLTGEQRTSATKIILQIGVSAICGFFFGVAMEKARVFEPESIRDQMVFERWIMLKMFLAAVASGQFFFSILSVLPWASTKFETASSKFVQCFTDKGLLTSALGPVILGAGMTLSGACPGMVLIQLGTWTPNAVFTLLGALIGAFLYGLIAPGVTALTKPKAPFYYQQVHTKFKKPYIMFALPMAVMLGVVVFLMEYFIPYKNDLNACPMIQSQNEAFVPVCKDDSKYKHPERLSYNIAETIAWPPFAAGILVGLLQVPIVLIIGDTIGGSTSYVTLTSQWVFTKSLQQKFPYMAKKRTGIGNWWQVIYVCLAVIGGCVSAVASSSLASIQGVGVLEALFGGMLMLIGARLGAGCTSGHGLSGMGLLAWLSFLAVPFMFCGAIVTAFSMRVANGALDRLVWSTLDM